MNMGTRDCGIAADSEPVGSSLFCPAAAAPGHQGSPRHRVDKGNMTQGREQEQGSHVHQPTRENPAKRSAGSLPAPTPATGQRAPMAAGRQKRNPGGPRRRRVKALRRRPGRPHHDRVLRMETNRRRRRGRRLGRKKKQHMQTTQTERKGTAYPPHALGHTQGTGQWRSARRRDSPQRGAQGHKSAGWRDPRAPRREPPKPPTAHQAKAQARARVKGPGHWRRNTQTHACHAGEE
jgi:hypothetical protein